MALSKTATNGFEFHRTMGPGEIFYLPADPGITVAAGDMLNGPAELGVGVLTLGVKADANMLFVAEKGVTVPAATTAFPAPGKFDPSNNNDSKNNTLVQCTLIGNSMVSLYKVAFANEHDEAVAAVNAATRSIGMTTGMTADDYPNGGIVYFYGSGGAAAGEANIVEDYDHADGNVDKEIITHRRQINDPDTNDSVIVLAGEAAGSRGISFFGLADIADEDQLTVNDGANDGTQVIVMSWADLDEYVSKGQIIVSRAQALYVK